MKTLTDELRELIESFPLETLQLKWEEVASRGYEGPLISDFLGIEATFIPSEICFVELSAGLSEEFDVETNFVVAA